MTYNARVLRGAAISECGLYRYQLWRRWGKGPSVVWVMLNPSTADAEEDDPTIRRCVGFAQQWGYNAIEVVNLFAFRATNPTDLLSAEEPVGHSNFEVFTDLSLRHHESHPDRVGLIVCAWGASVRKSPALMKQEQAVLGWLSNVKQLSCLGTTKQGHPKHPLYLRKDTPYEGWTP